MTHLVFDSAAESLAVLAHLLCAEGDVVSPRGLKTLEVTDLTIELTDPRDCTMYGVGREGYHPAIGVAEGLLLIAGFSDPGLLTRVAPVFKRFQDGGALHGAYGPRLARQLPLVEEKLIKDWVTRQAVATIWDPHTDLWAHDVPRDVPCTVYLLFRVRRDQLELKVHMRSNDCWRGWCYDVIQFTQLQCTMAQVLGLEPGRYVHHADSFHVYEQDLDALNKVSRTDLLPGIELARPRLDGLQVGSWRAARRRAQELLYAPDQPQARTQTEQWMLDRLARALSPKEGS